MRKYAKKELKNILLEATKYLLAQFILQNLNKDTLKFKKLLEMQNFLDFLNLYEILTATEKNILKMNVSAKTGKFLEDYEKLWIEQKQKFLSENLGKLLLTLWIAIADNLKLE